MTTTDLRTRTELAVEAARKAGDLANDIFHSTFDVEVKADQSPVTVADKRAEQLIRELVGRHFPADGLLGEEFGDQPGMSGFRWVIDPIDGTKSFIRKLPLWGTLVGLEYHGDPVAGAVYVPGMHQLFHASRGNGAYRDGHRIRVSTIDTLADSLLCYSSISWFRRNGREAAFLELAEKTDRQRGYGDFLGFLFVAQGSAELMIDHGVHPWDVVALVPIVEEAGGVMTAWDNSRTTERPDVIASNGRLHAETLRILNG